MNNLNQPYPQQWPDQQRGVVLVLVTVAMLALLAMAALALDGGHLLLNKTRLQNAVDAAALSAARTIADYPDDSSVAVVHAAAEASAMETFLNNLGLADNTELNTAYAGAGSPLSVEFSTTLNPFTHQADALPYVRVTASGLQLRAWLLQVVGLAEKPVSASAVAGPIGLNATTCDVLPILACGCIPGEGDCPEDSFFGYPDIPVGLDGEAEVPANPTIDDFSVIKLSSGDPSDVGPGNFRLLRLDGIGGSDLRQALAGIPAECASIGEDRAADTEPGNKVGPVAQGLNTRFGIYNGPVSAATAPGDVVTYTHFSGSSATGPTPANGNRLMMEGYDPETGEPIIKREDGTTDVSDIFDYHDYLNEYASLADNACDEGGCRRRELVLPIGQCDSSINGTSTDVAVYGIGCFFLLQTVTNGGDAEVFGQFFGGGCSAVGTFTDEPADENAPIKIVLFRDSGSGDS